MEVQYELSNSMDDLTTWMEQTPIGRGIVPREQSFSARYIGQVYARRPLSRKMLFLSLRVDGSLGLGRVEVLVRVQNVGAENMEQVYWNIRIGDLVDASGFIENSGNTTGKPFIVAETVHLLRSWADVHPTIQFTPFERLPPVHGLPERLQKELDAAIDSGSDVIPTRASSETISHPATKKLKLANPSLNSPTQNPTDIASTSALAGPSAGPHIRVAGAAKLAVMPSAREEGWFEGIPLHRLCRYYISTGRCLRSQCGQLHSVDEFLQDRDPTLEEFNMGQLKFAWGVWRSKTRAMGRSERFGEENEEHDSHESKAGHSARAIAFSDWIEANIPREILQKGVLDIAGGRGDVAFRLASMYDIPVTTIEPRHVKMRKQHRTFWNKHPEKVPPKHIQAFFGPDFVSIKEHGELIANCGLVIGFHPDEATEPILDFALVTGKPVVIVPCCVFSRIFPNRMNRNGETVTSYEQFVAYLREKAAGETGEVMMLNPKAVQSANIHEQVQEPSNQRHIRVPFEDEAAASGLEPSQKMGEETLSMALRRKLNLQVDYLPYHGRNVILYWFPDAENTPPKKIKLNPPSDVPKKGESVGEVLVEQTVGDPQQLQ